MVFLTLMIILPPLFRMMFPKQIEDKNNKTLNRIEILSCERTISNSNYSTSVKVTYKNSQIEQNVITYMKIDDSIKSGASRGDLSPEEESSYFSKLNDIDIVNNESSVIVTLNKKSLENNSNDRNLSNYLQTIDKQEAFYSELGYSCSVDVK